MVDSMLDHPRVSCLKRSRFEHAQIKTCAIFSDGQLHPIGASNPPAQIRAGNPGAAHLNDGSTQPHSIAHADLIFGDMVHGNVFADASGL